MLNDCQHDLTVPNYFAAGTVGKTLSKSAISNLSAVVNMFDQYAKVTAFSKRGLLASRKATSVQD